MDSQRPKRKAALAAAAASRAASAPAPHCRKRHHDADDDGQMEEEGEDEDEAMDESSSSSSESGSDWEDIARGNKGVAARKKQRLDADGRAAGVAAGRKGAAKERGRGRGKAKAKAPATEEGDHEEGDGPDGGGVADTDMEDAAAVVVRGPEDVLAAFHSVSEALKEQLVLVEEAKAKAEEVFSAMDALPPPQTHTAENHMRAIERQRHVLISMGCRNGEAQLHSAAVTAREQTEEFVKKIDTLQHYMDNLNQNDQEELLCLEGLLEGLWMSDDQRVGIGGYLGFISTMECLSSVSQHFKSLTQQPAMHPILELNRCPKPDIANTWLETGRLAACQSFAVDHRPMPSLVRLLEATAATVRDIQTSSRSRHGRQWREPIQMPPRGQQLVFPQLHKASVHQSWSQIAQDRDYQLPALTELGASELTSVWFPATGPRSWVSRASAGIHSLVLTTNHHQTYGNVPHFLSNTPSWNTLVSLKGAHGIPDDDFIDQMGGGGARTARLQTIEMNLGYPIINSVMNISSVHRFRTSCLAPNATETYPDIHLRLPFHGSAADLAAGLPTAQTLCTQAETVDLFSQATAGQEDHPDLTTLKCAKIKKLTMLPSGGGHPLPPYVLANPASLFPAVESVEVEERDFGGMGFYDGGLGAVLGDLPSLERVTFSSDVWATPHTELCLIPPSVGFFATEGRPLTVAFHVTIGDLQKANSTSHYITWSLYDGEGGEGAGAGAGAERERGLMESGRVSRIEVEISTKAERGFGRASGLSDSRAKEMHRSFAQCVAAALAANASLDCIALTVRPSPRYNLLRVLRDASKGRFGVSPPEGDESWAFEMRRANGGTSSSSSSGKTDKGGLKRKRDTASKAG
ncbi:unnamed protein product [Vitrella brassicaformis CCMP3155]|uniref:Uncharacterized protein n=1 Tax=Vitrella brassicaformis (strain CCMP3155) TaxID=1169540 RepID=A0A0G4EYL6_VITBC|nr:unnamed protein product [Vitrella brassicaformis CCMP3155]|eukprot:CEM03550.1 unnamed protein product [Vitrella brassicaformis CCMP3155]